MRLQVSQDNLIGVTGKGWSPAYLDAIANEVSLAEGGGGAVGLDVVAGVVMMPMLGSCSPQSRARGKSAAPARTGQKR